MNRFLLLFLSVVYSPGWAQHGTGVVIGQSFGIESKILGEQRTYLVSLPASYEGDDFYINKRYPVMIVLDGERLFEMASAVVRSMSSGDTEQIPEMIVVGVANTDRNRDMLPNHTDASASGANKFRAFIETELLPLLDQQYRTSNCRVLVGHSYAGLFTVDTFLKSETFRGFVAIDPSLYWEDQVLVKSGPDLLSARPSFTASIYFGQANNPFNEGIEAGRLGRAVQAFTRMLDSLKADNIRYHTDFYENQDHFSIPLICLYNGLQFVFEGYKYPLNQIKSTDAEAIRNHYLDLSARWGGRLPPPGKLLNQVGRYLLEDEGRIADAIKILEFSAESYPNSETPYLSLARGYQRAGDVGKAAENYNLVLQLNPGNEEAQARLKEIGN